jgi:hypothetical protein
MCLNILTLLEAEKELCEEASPFSPFPFVRTACNDRLIHTSAGPVVTKRVFEMCILYINKYRPILIKYPVKIQAFLHIPFLFSCYGLLSQCWHYLHIYWYCLVFVVLNAPSHDLRVMSLPLTVAVKSQYLPGKYGWSNWNLYSLHSTWISMKCAKCSDIQPTFIFHYVTWRRLV